MKLRVKTFVMCGLVCISAVASAAGGTTTDSGDFTVVGVGSSETDAYADAAGTAEDALDAQCRLQGDNCRALPPDGINTKWPKPTNIAVGKNSDGTVTVAYDLSGKCVCEDKNKIAAVDPLVERHAIYLE